MLYLRRLCAGWNAAHSPLSFSPLPISPLFCCCLDTKSYLFYDHTQGSSVQGISQARILEWVAVSSSGDLPDPGMDSVSPVLAGRFFTTEPPEKPQPLLEIFKNFIGKVRSTLGGNTTIYYELINHHRSATLRPYLLTFRKGISFPGFCMCLFLNSEDHTVY